MSSHETNEARVIPLRPAAVAAPPVTTVPVTAPRVTAAPKEPLWRHIVGDVLRRERLAQERTLKDVADAARISMPYLSELERGRKEASSEVLAAAARALGLGLADLLALTQGELARLSPVSSGRDLGPGRSAASAASGGGGDEAVLRSVSELKRLRAQVGAPQARVSRRTDLCLAA